MGGLPARGRGGGLRWSLRSSWVSSPNHHMILCNVQNSARCGCITWFTFEVGPALTSGLDKVTSRDPLQSKLFYNSSVWFIHSMFHSLIFMYQNRGIFFNCFDFSVWRNIFIRVPLSFPVKMLEILFLTKNIISKNSRWKIWQFQK